MNLTTKIKHKFQNFFRFEKLYSSDNFDFDESIQELESKDNIILFKDIFEKHSELKEIIWIAMYHCLNTFKFKNECLTL